MTRKTNIACARVRAYHLPDKSTEKVPQHTHGSRWVDDDERLEVLLKAKIVKMGVKQPRKKGVRPEL